MLTYYENEIRQWHSRLEEQYRNPELAANDEPAANDEAPQKDAGAKDGKLFLFLFLSFLCYNRLNGLLQSYAKHSILT
jgi:hypothetical protein